MNKFEYGTGHLTASIALAIASGKVKAHLSSDTIKRILASSAFVDEIVNNHQTVYGINTGFGPLCDTKISIADTRKLQHNILQSHSVGIGKPIPKEIAKLMLITKVHSLSKGYSGINIETLKRIIWHIEQDHIPLVPEKGSVGASGDLAPLSHLFLPLIGLGEVESEGKIIPAKQLLHKYQLEPISLGPKEGLALINGTQFILAFATKAVQRMHQSLETADLIGALSIEGLMGSTKPFDPKLHQLRPFDGCINVAQRLNNLLHDSEILASHTNCDRVQDPYSLRCMPQVHGASRHSWLHLKELTEIELNSVTDNPIIFSASETISGGNFHGQPLALPLDYATFASAELGNIADRRCYLMLEGRYGLPKLLINDAGLNSGFMIPQYTTAALVTENKTLSFPASVDSIPTSLGQEDHVSMGSISGRKLHQVLDNLDYIQAIELLYAVQAIDFRRPLKSSPILEACHEFVRETVSFATEDRLFADDINQLYQLVASGNLLAFANNFAQQSGLKLNQDEKFSIY